MTRSSVLAVAAAAWSLAAEAKRARRTGSAVVLALLLWTCCALSQTYHLGPRGGCYTITASGSKRYVDKSLCAPATGQ